MKRWLIRILLVLSLLSLGGGAYLAIYHYYLFPNSHTLFAWQHRNLPHLWLHTQQWNVAAGDSLYVYASRHTGHDVALRLIEPLTGQTVLSQEVWVAYQAVPERPAIEGTGWQPHIKVALPTGLESGWYLLQVDDGVRQATTSIFVVPDTHTRKLALLLSTNTWNAYNFWGGQSIYTAANPTPTVSFHRPQLTANPYIADRWQNHQLFYQAANKDLPLYALLDSAGMRPDVFSIEVLQTQPEWLTSYDGLIISTHSEYWSMEMMEHLNAYLDSGGSLINLAGNVAAYRTYLDSAAGTMTIFRKLDQLWEYQDTVGLRPFGTQPDFLGFHTYAPYQVILDSSWVWEGMNVQSGDLIGQTSRTYDYTYMYDSWWKNLINLGNKGDHGAAAGLELDKLYAGTPANWQTIAIGLNPRIEGHGEVWPDPAARWETAGAVMGYYDHPGGGIVFGVGSMAFTGSIPCDRHIRQLIINVAQHVQRP